MGFTNLKIFGEDQKISNNRKVIHFFMLNYFVCLVFLPIHKTIFTSALIANFSANLGPVYWPWVHLCDYYTSLLKIDKSFLFISEAGSVFLFLVPFFSLFLFLSFLSQMMLYQLWKGEIHLYITTLYIYIYAMSQSCVVSILFSDFPYCCVIIVVIGNDLY